LSICESPADEVEHEVEHKAMTQPIQKIAKRSINTLLPFNPCIRGIKNTLLPSPKNPIFFNLYIRGKRKKTSHGLYGLYGKRIWIVALLLKDLTEISVQVNQSLKICASVAKKICSPSQTRSERKAPTQSIC